MSVLAASDYLAIFQTSRGHWRSLLELSRTQRNLINTDDYTGLLAVFGRKQRILGRLDELKQRYPGIRQQWQAQRESIEPALRADCEDLLAETETILAELLKEEKLSIDHLTQRRDATQRQLQAISKGTEVHQAYRDHLAPATHRHLDVGQ